MNFADTLLQTSCWTEHNYIRFGKGVFQEGGRKLLQTITSVWFESYSLLFVVFRTSLLRLSKFIIRTQFFRPHVKVLT